MLQPKVEQAIQSPDAPRPKSECQGDCSLTYVPLEPLSTISDPNLYKDFAGYLRWLFPILISIGALVGVATLTVSGVLYMTSAAGGETKAAKERMKNAILGLIILIASVLILQTVNPDLITFNLQSLKVLTSQSK